MQLWADYFDGLASWPISEDLSARLGEVYDAALCVRISYGALVGSHPIHRPLWGTDLSGGGPASHGWGLKDGGEIGASGSRPTHRMRRAIEKHRPAHHGRSYDDGGSPIPALLGARGAHRASFKGRLAQLGFLAALLAAGGAGGVFLRFHDGSRSERRGGWAPRDGLLDASSIRGARSASCSCLIGPRSSMLAADLSAAPLAPVNAPHRLFLLRGEGVARSWPRLHAVGSSRSSDRALADSRTLSRSRSALRDCSKRARGAGQTAAPEMPAVCIWGGRNSEGRCAACAGRASCSLERRTG